KSITINSLPTTGTLQLGGVNVKAGDVISAGSITSLTFVPNTDVTTTGSFSFSVTDTTGNITSAPATMTINVTPDAGPSALTSSITATENATYTFKVADFGYSDPDASPDPLGSVIITSLPTNGTLQLNGAAVALNQPITASQISAGQLTFVPNSNVTTAVFVAVQGHRHRSRRGERHVGHRRDDDAEYRTPRCHAVAAAVLRCAEYFNTVGTDNGGFYMIPPDPNAAVGVNTVISATNACSRRSPRPARR